MVRSFNRSRRPQKNRQPEAFESAFLSLLRSLINFSTLSSRAGTFLGWRAAAFDSFRRLRSNG